MPQESNNDRPRTVFGREFYPLVTHLGGPFGRQKLAVAAEVIVTHDRADDRAGVEGPALLIDRHVNPDAELPLGVFVTQDTPAEDVRRDGPYLSLAVRPPQEDGDPPGGELCAADSPDSPHAREWDFLKEHARKALDAAGVSESAADAEKMHAFAEYAMNFKKSPAYHSFHPVDVLFHRSYCTGTANVQSALAAVAGLPSRTVCISNHTMNEVHIDGRWHFVDNHVDGARLVAGSDYVDVTLNAQRYAQFSDKQRGYLSGRRPWARSPWHYSGMLRWHWAWGAGKDRGIRTDVMDGYGVSVPCDPHHAHALYPERSHYPFPLWNDAVELTLTEKASWLRANLLLQPGQSLVKAVHVGPSDDNPITAARVEWWFRGEVSPEDVVLAADGGRCLEATATVPGTEGVLKLRFDLPVAGFAAPGEHYLVLTNRSDRILNPVAYPTPLVRPPLVSSDPEQQLRPQSLASEPIVY